mgnify:CR=1 FL=1
MPPISERVLGSYYFFEQGSYGARQCKDVARCVVGSVSVAILAKRYILVSVHGFSPPVMLVNAQDALGIGLR